MSKPWYMEPQLDDSGKVGLSLIDLLFALVLAQAFIETTTGYRHIQPAGWSQLVLAFFAIVLSWLGYHASKAAEHLWMTKFFNKPLMQYFVDLLILAAYWALIITAEGVPIAPDKPDMFLYSTSARPETLIIAVIFLLYAAYDALEVSITEDRSYIRVRILAEGDKSLVLVEPDNHPRTGPHITADVVTRWPHLPERFNRRPIYRGTFYAYPARLMRSVTYAGLFLSTILALSVWIFNPRTSAPVIMIDGLCIVGLIVYRKAQSGSRRFFASTSPNLKLSGHDIVRGDGSPL